MIAIGGAICAGLGFYWNHVDVKTKRQNREKDD